LPLLNFWTHVKITIMTGNKKVDTIIVLLMLIITLATAGVFTYTVALHKAPVVNDEQQKQEMMNSVGTNAIPQFFKVEKMVISLIPKEDAANARMRWLEIEMHLILFDPADEAYLKDHIAIVKDRMIEIASRMGANELNSVSGKILLEDRLKREINKALLKPVVKNIFFTNFIVQ